MAIAHTKEVDNLAGDKNQGGVQIENAFEVDSPPAVGNSTGPDESGINRHMVLAFLVSLGL